VVADLAETPPVFRTSGRNADDATTVARRASDVKVNAK
jgi:hypothetical protein